METPIRIGDKVFTSDGRVGRVLSVCECDRCRARGFYEPLVRYDDGTEESIPAEQMEKGFPDFYMIGKNMIGNKVPAEELEERIAEQRKICEAESKKLDNLRKQLWTLNERMVPDWRERLEAKNGKKKEK